MLLSAAMITRDAEAVLAAGLSSLFGVADEVVLHDTGSQDGTVALAVASGARVSSGPWADSFAAARNEALSRAHGEWVLSLDADERLEGDARAFRRWLQDVREPVLALTVRNDDVDAAFDYEFHAVRLFRRAGARWTGRVHERLLLGGAEVATPLRTVPLDLLVLRHSGYAGEGAQQRKGERNGRLAAMELAELTADPSSDPVDVARVALHVGRAAVGTGDLQRAVDAFEAVRDLVDSGPLWAEATDHMARVLLGAGEAWIALLLADQLAQTDVNPAYCRWLRGQALAQTGSPREALRELEGLHEIVDTAGRRYDPAPLEQMRDLCRMLL